MFENLGFFAIQVFVFDYSRIYKSWRKKSAISETSTFSTWPLKIIIWHCSNDRVITFNVHHYLSEQFFKKFSQLTNQACSHVCGGAQNFHTKIFIAFDWTTIGQRLVEQIKFGQQNWVHFIHSSLNTVQVSNLDCLVKFFQIS